MLNIARNPTYEPRITSGLRAGLAYAYFFLDPVGSIKQASEDLGPVSAFGDVIPSRHRRRLHVLALGPEFNRQVFSQPEIFHSGKLITTGPRHSAHSRLRCGLTALNAESHAFERPLALALFSKANVDAYHEPRVNMIEKIIRRWPTGSPFDIWPELESLTLRLTADFLFGPAREQGYELGKSLFGWMDSGWCLPVMLLRHDLPLTPFRRMLRQAETIEEQMRSLVDSPSNSGLPDHFTRWLQSHSAALQERKDAPLSGQIATLILASVDTVVSALAWTLLLLAQHPRVMADVADELAGALGGEPADRNQLEQLSLLDSVIKESLRLLPPIPYTTRKAVHDVEIGGVALQARQKVFCSHYYTHHMPALYPSPEEFQPERWLHMKPGPYEYVPFGAGPRTCIGYPYAMAVLKVSLSIILQRFRLMVLPNARMDRSVRITLRPKWGLPVVLYPQDGRYTGVPLRGNIHEMVEFPNV